MTIPRKTSPRVQATESDTTAPRKWAVMKAAL
jgi:hypothetical protein